MVYKKPKQEKGELNFLDRTSQNTTEFILTLMGYAPGDWTMAKLDTAQYKSSHSVSIASAFC